jgi:thiamine pyrophosphokinase
VIEPDVVVVASGQGPLVEVPAARAVVAADGGLDRAASLGLAVDVVVGDLDSVSPVELERAEAKGVRVVRHPEAKDATDLELALDEAVALGAKRVLVVASAGGRLDHLLASLLLLGSERYEALEVDAFVGEALVHVIRGERTMHGTAGDLVTLLALGEPASGVTTEGLAYPLADDSLDAGSTRGVSNVFVGGEATVSVARGVLLAVRPPKEPA